MVLFGAWREKNHKKKFNPGFVNSYYLSIFLTILNGSVIFRTAKNTKEIEHAEKKDYKICIINVFAFNLGCICAVKGIKKT